jgi:hypothetical protein
MPGRKSLAQRETNKRDQKYNNLSNRSGGIGVDDRLA